MIRAIARQAEVERTRRAKMIHATSEIEASTHLTQAANKLAEEPYAIMLRYFQTLTEIAGEKNSPIIFPIPMELISGVVKSVKATTKE
jgi:hypothetical protein